MVYNDPEDPVNPGMAEYPSLGGLRNDMGVYGGPGRMNLIDIPVSVDDHINMNLPADFELFQNYPNPFNPKTTIRFSVNTEEEVKIELFDILGREISELISGRFTPGTYDYILDASYLSSGIYYYSLTTQTSSDTKSLVVLK